MNKYLFITFLLLASLLGFFMYQRVIFFDGNLHIVFCDVGQGDAIFIRTPSGKDILIDGGIGDSVLSCLSKNMPFWDRTIDVIISTHPHADHFQGLISVLQRYTVLSFYTEKVDNTTPDFSELLKQIKEEKLERRFVFSGDTVRFSDGVVIRIVGPFQETLDVLAGQAISETQERASVISYLSYGSFDFLFTGDSEADELQKALNEGLVGDIDVLQVPHHGSASGLNSEIVEILDPEVAVISVGKNNKYNHPRKEITDILSGHKIPVKRTDRDGDVHFIVDSKSWVLRP